MYLKNEIPKISASVFYYDTVYQQSTAEHVLEILERKHRCTRGTNKIK